MMFKLRREEVARFTPDGTPYSSLYSRTEIIPFIVSVGNFVEKYTIEGTHPTWTKKLA